MGVGGLITFFYFLGIERKYKSAQISHLHNPSCFEINGMCIPTEKCNVLKPSTPLGWGKVLFQKQKKKQIFFGIY